MERLHAADATFEATIRTTLVRMPFEVAQDADIVQVVGRQAAKLLGSTPELMGSAGWMDAALLTASGIPTVIFGPGGAGAHAIVEWADLEQLQQCSAVLVNVIREFCA